ncbi:MAG: tRNA pseudouridine(55) synthase TruB [Anaerolineaceae bacterium]|nr:MAG: tRNA pseudouridine(55) synthase TruB [Anaerolineaceae bacterium]
MINGIININKEKGFTSHDVVAKMRGILRIKKIGHTGTLDPEAEGVLPVCIGKATKVVDLIVDKDKTYEAVLKLGIVTDTQDMTGTILRRSRVDMSLDRIKKAAENFIGGYDQIPPMYSALKVNGQKLYELARQGKVVERMPRRVDIHNIEILECDFQDYEVRLRVDCGKGTYIRTLLYDIGQVLGCGGVMKSLIRSRVGSFNIADALRLNQVEEYVRQGTINDYIFMIDDMFLSYPKVIVNDKYSKLIHNGNPFKEEHLDNIQEFIEEALQKSEPSDINISVRVYDSCGVFIGIYRYYKVDKRFHADKMFL